MSAYFSKGNKLRMLLKKKKLCVAESQGYFIEQQ